MARRGRLRVSKGQAGSEPSTGAPGAPLGAVGKSGTGAPRGLSPGRARPGTGPAPVTQATRTGRAHTPPLCLLRASDLGAGPSLAFLSLSPRCSSSEDELLLGVTDSAGVSTQ